MSSFIWFLVGALLGGLMGAFGFACLLVWTLGWGCEPDQDAGRSDPPWRDWEVR